MLFINSSQVEEFLNAENSKKYMQKFCKVYIVILKYFLYYSCNIVWIMFVDDVNKLSLSEIYGLIIN